MQITGRTSTTDQAIQRLIRDLNSRPLDSLVCSTGTVYGSQYLTVEPIGGSWLDMESWCYDTFGSSGASIWGSDIPEPRCRWYANNRKFWFRDCADRDWFVLRWSS